MSKGEVQLYLNLSTDSTLAHQNRDRNRETETCNQIREVRRLAIREGLEDENLATLEYRYCANNESVNNSNQVVSQDCLDLMVMVKLAQIGARDNTDLIRMIEGLKQATCNLPDSQRRNSFNWVNGQWAKSGSSWYYPNGQWAKSGSSWYYPNGQWAKSGSSWYYPNGHFASAESLLAWACSILDSRTCDRRLNELKNQSQFWQELAIIELAWQAHQQQNK